MSEPTSGILKHIDFFFLCQALLAYDAAGTRSDFCKSHYLHEKSMAEMSDLRRQLGRILCSHYSSTGTALQRLHAIIFAVLCLP